MAGAGAVAARRLNGATADQTFLSSDESRLDQGALRTSHCTQRSRSSLPRQRVSNSSGRRRTSLDQRKLQIPEIPNLAHQTAQKIRASILGIRPRKVWSTNLACKRPRTRGLLREQSEMSGRAAMRGWGGRIRTSVWRNQNPLPYHLATPHRGRFGRPKRADHSAEDSGPQVGDGNFCLSGAPDVAAVGPSRTSPIHLRKALAAPVSRRYKTGTFQGLAACRRVGV